MNLSREIEFLKKFKLRKEVHTQKRKGKKRSKKRKLKIENLTKMITAPEIFSISENPDELILFFKRVRFHCYQTKKQLIIDMKNIKKVDVDSLIYLKYIVYLTKEVRRKNKQMTFRSPKNKELKEYIYNTGFVTYTNRPFYMEKTIENSTKYFSIEDKQTENFKIKRDNTINRDILRKIIEFAEEKIGQNKVLHPIIHEMMENTVFHAYKDKEDIEHKDWYFFAEFLPGKLAFIFLDTGLGITETARRKWTDLFKIKDSESYILKEVLLGKHRSQTGEVYRGKGLPHIYEKYKEKEILNLRIISNKGCYNINSNSDLTDSLDGTFFYWEIEA